MCEAIYNKKKEKQRQLIPYDISTFFEDNKLYFFKRVDGVMILNSYQFRKEANHPG
jgi:hypothetical protein